MRPRRADRNGDGHIDVSEVHTVMRNLGYNTTMEEAKRMTTAIDTDGNGTIEFDEFVGMMAQRMLKSDGKAELQMAIHGRMSTPHLSTSLDSVEASAPAGPRML